jgi:hypothetical protein
MTDAAPAPHHKTNALFKTNTLKLGPFSLNADGILSALCRRPRRQRGAGRSHEHGAAESAG